MSNQMLNPDTSVNPMLKPYQAIHPETGEIVNKYKYLEGHPKQYRFDAKEGKFNINGVETLGSVFTFHPLAWRIFSDNILNMGTKNWAELFFVDDKNCISVLLFHGYSVDNIYRLIEPLFYDDLTLADVLITATAIKKENTKITPKGVYYIAEFSYTVAPKEQAQALKTFARDFKVYRQETITDISNIKVAHGFYNPFATGNTEVVGPEPEEQATAA